MKRIPVILALILLYIGWNGRELMNAWISSPLEKYAWLAFIIWCIPVVVAKKQLNRLLITLSLIATTLGIVGSLNTLHYIAIAFALAGLIPWNWILLPWILSSICWMPAYSWLILTIFSVNTFGILRVFVALSAVITLIPYLKSQKTRNYDETL